MEGNIFNIQKYCIHDGPGIRTTVFFKGCNLRCFWCHNPESLRIEPQLQLFLDKCIGCGKCFAVCPTGAHRMMGTNHEFLQELCNGCGKCADVCYVEALVLRGRSVSVKEVIDEVEKDRPYYETSGGGVTFSGGEPLIQKDFLLCLLRECKAAGLHTAVDTAGNVPKETIEAAMPFVDLWLYDIKMLDEAKHREATGAGNSRILENIKMLAALDKEIIVRVTVVPGVNDNQAEMESIAGFISGLKTVKHVELLPFHRMAGGKYQSLGMEYRAEGLEPPASESLQAYAEIFKQLGINAKAM